MKIEAFCVDKTGKRIVAEPLNYALSVGVWFTSTFNFPTLKNFLKIY